MDSDLSAAEKLFFRGKYSKVLRSLEPQVFQYRDSYRFYILLGYSCLYTGDFGGGFSYLRRAEQLSPGDTPANLGIALVLAKRGETEEAIKIWLSILERKGESKEAQRGLRLIREAREFSDITLKLEEGRLDRYLHYPKRRASRLKPLLISVLVLVLAGAGIGVWKTGLAAKIFSHGYTRPELKGLDFFDLGQESKTPGAAYELTESQVRDTAQNILDLMNNYRDNLARREINRLLLSNASDEIKEKARYLIGFIQAPTFATLKDSFTFREVSADPKLYEGCYVAWRGRSANIEIGNTSILFDLLVGYEDETLLEGVVPVSLNFAVNIEENKKIEVLGKVSLSGEGKKEADGPLIRLQGISVHQLID